MEKVILKSKIIIADKNQHLPDLVRLQLGSAEGLLIQGLLLH